jgi:uncharacterized protein (DUF305 family)
MTVSGSGRYVRLLGTQRATQYGYSLWEFQVYGTGGAPNTPPTPPADPANPPQLIWADEFDGANGTKPDAAKWTADPGNGQNGELQVYTNNNNTQLDGQGHLVLEARREVTPGSACPIDPVSGSGTCQYTSARMNTGNKFSTTYGKIEARIKVPKGNGLWPAFWMMGSDFLTGRPWPYNGEIEATRGPWIYDPPVLPDPQPGRRRRLPRPARRRYAVPRAHARRLRAGLPLNRGEPMKALAAAVLLVVLTGCGSSVAASPPPASTPTVAASAFNPTDLAWIELMIPMDEQLLRVLSMAEKQAADPAVRKLAAQLGAGHRAELAQLVALRTKAGAPTTNMHEGHDMPGMMTEPQIVALGKITGVAFDKLFEKNLKEHLEQSIVVARSIRTAGQEPAVKKLAAAIEVSRAAQLSQL